MSVARAVQAWRYRFQVKKDRASGPHTPIALSLRAHRVSPCVAFRPLDSVAEAPPLVVAPVPQPPTEEALPAWRVGAAPKPFFIRGNKCACKSSVCTSIVCVLAWAVLLMRFLQVPATCARDSAMAKARASARLSARTGSSDSSSIWAAA